MTALEKPVPPSGNRVRSAAASGHFPKSAIMIFGAMLISLGVTLTVAGPHLPDFFHRTLAEALSIPQSSPQAARFASSAFIGTLTTLIVLLCAMSIPILTAWFAPALIFRAGKGRTAVKLPEDIRAGSAYWIVGVLSASLALLTLAASLRNGGAFELSLNAPSRLFPDGVRHAGTLTARAGLILFLGGLIQLFLYKAALFQQLSLTRDEAAKEQRLHGANPLVRGRIRKAAGN